MKNKGFRIFFVIIILKLVICPWNIQPLKGEKISQPNLSQPQLSTQSNQTNHKVKPNLEGFYLDGQFNLILAELKESDYQKLSLWEKLLYIECKARTSAGQTVIDHLKQLLKEKPQHPGVLSVAAIVYLSTGEFDQAETYLTKSLSFDSKAPRALVTLVLLKLYQQRFVEAGKIYENLTGIEKQWRESEFLFLVGIDVYRALGAGEKLRKLYLTHAARVKKKNKRYYESLKADSRMLKRLKGKLFQVKADTDNIVKPFSAEENDLRLNTISITVKGKSFKVILDSGNGTGWLVHSRELNELLKPKNGGKTIARIGSESGIFDGKRQYYETVEFNSFKLHHLSGIYIPKPRSNFPDANLNPSFIRDRVVVIDFVKRNLRLQSKERFERELSLLSKGTFSRLPWIGYKFPYVQVKVKGEANRKGLAMIETGADEIALNLNFLQGMELPLQPKVKYLANGQVINYHLAEVALLVGNFLFLRKEAEVWPLHDFYNRLSGLSPDVVLGPNVFSDRYAIAFDPFDKKIVIIKKP